MALSRKPNKYGLDPFLMVDTARANYYYGRTDVSSDEIEGGIEAIADAAKGKDPELDRTLPWILLVRGMYSYLYKKAAKEDNRRRGRKKRIPSDPLPSPITIQPYQWAEAFNIITFTYVKGGFLKQPRTISRQKTADGRTIALALVIQDPGRGRDKTNSYLTPERRRETIKVLRRMERHRLALGRDKDVQKHLVSLRNPDGS